MNKRSIRVLEFNKILEQLEEYAVTDGAKKRIQRLKPLRDRAVIEGLQQNTRDAFLRLERHGQVSFSGVTNVTESLRLLEIDSALSAAELLEIARLLETAAEVKKYGSTAGDEGEYFDSLTTHFEMLVPLEDISSEIRRCIISSDEIADDASGNLKSIRRKIITSEANLHNTLQKIIKNSSNRDMLMDALVTTRNGRYCIPVKIEYKNAFPGMVHDRSSTGSTIFIEPMEIVELNNTIQDLHSEELMEIEKILSDLSQMTAPVREDIQDNYKTLIELDFIFAKAKYAKATNASEPTWNDDGIIELKSAVHPLLDRKTAVPVDITLGRDYNLLIITGPNTGGKTVSLKTLGLLTLMGQAGLHIPAMPGSSLSVFDDVFADIGDEQSIELSLSTFSSHMSNIIFIVKHANDKSLVLFDEPGGGTDPAEGAALAIAILNDLKAKGARVMATTHYTELKTYALGTEGVENASCEFDVKTLKPTYKLIIGIPGASNAFAIAKRLGMPDEITDAAREGMDESQLNMERIISELEAERKEMTSLREELEIQLNDEKILTRRLTDKEKNLDKKKNDILEQAKVEAREIIDDAKNTADSAIRDYNKWLKNPQSASAKAMEETRSKLRKKKESYHVEEEEIPAERSTHNPSDFKVGDRVKVLSMDSEGIINREANAKNLLEVMVGNFKSMVTADDLVLLKEKKETDNRKYQKMASTFRNSGLAYTFKPEINLLGKTVDDATALLDKFLDDALMMNAEQVTIIHGKGTGALKRGILEYLKRKSFVKEFRSGEFGEGDSGVTIVKL